MSSLIIGQPGINFHSSLAKYNSMLEIPDGRNPNQNAWLTITVNYSLNFADSQNHVPGVIVKNDAGVFARDSDGEMFPILDWDFESSRQFNKRFKKAESFWNHKFLLITPKFYGGLDYQSPHGNGWICRPNVLCLFRLTSGGRDVHLPLTVVRAKTVNQFRSNSEVYDDDDVTNRVVLHELGHNLNQLHILALLGVKECMGEKMNERFCYKTPKGFEPNIMGEGNALHPINAKAWKDCIERHTGIADFRWHVTMATNTPPRKMPMAFKDESLMPRYW